MSYVSPKAVLQEAGLWNRQVGEALGGAVDDTNTVFTTTYKPLVQNTNSETVSVADVSAYVNGSPVVVSSLDATTGALTLASAPAEGSEVSADYVASAISQSDVADVIEEADEWIDLELASVTTVPAEIPATVRKIARFYAAGLLMSREYGLESITDETNKEGKRKLDQAEAWMAEYRARFADNTANTGGYGVPRASEDKRLFQTYDPSNSRWGVPVNETIKVQRKR